MGKQSKAYPKVNKLAHKHTVTQAVCLPYMHDHLKLKYTNLKDKIKLQLFLKRI